MMLSEGLVVKMLESCGINMALSPLKNFIRQAEKRTFFMPESAHYSYEYWMKPGRSIEVSFERLNEEYFRVEVLGPPFSWAK